MVARRWQAVGSPPLAAAQSVRGTPHASLRPSGLRPRRTQFPIDWSSPVKDNPKQHLLQVLVPLDVVQSLRAIARPEERTLSSEVRLALRRHVESSGAAPDQGGPVKTRASRRDVLSERNAQGGASTAVTNDAPDPPLINASAAARLLDVPASRPVRKLCGLFEGIGLRARNYVSCPGPARCRLSSRRMSVWSLSGGRRRSRCRSGRCSGRG